MAFGRDDLGRAGIWAKKREKEKGGSRKSETWTNIFLMLIFPYMDISHTWIPFMQTEIGRVPEIITHLDGYGKSGHEQENQPVKHSERGKSGFFPFTLQKASGYYYNPLEAVSLPRVGYGRALGTHESTFWHLRWDRTHSLRIGGPNPSPDMQQIADQTDVLISDHNKLVAIVNRVGAEQISQLNKVNELVNRTNVLHSQITAVSTYVSEIVQNISIAWTHMKFRTNVEYLISDVESRYRDFQELRNYMRDLKLSCEVGSVTEELLPVQLLRRITSDSRNQNSLTNEWYYRTLKVETMFRDRSGRLVCKYTVPLLASEPYLAYNIHTYPVFNPNASLALRLYHVVYVAIGTQTGELFYPEQCKRIDPVVCHAGLRYDKSRELCVRGLISGSPQQQSHCPVSLFKSINNSQSVKEVTRNKFVVHTPHEHYSYRCPDQKPLVDEITYGTYVIEIDQKCFLDTSSWMLEGLTYHEIYQYFNISDIEIPNIPILNSNSWHKFHTLLIDAN
ncbi:hypothetical protein CAPTEDRAFT_201479, partial [Capitella teleta]